MKKFLVFIFLIISIQSINAQLSLEDTLIDLNGDTTTINELSTDGSPAMIYFWNMGCTPCILTFNYIRENSEEWRANGFKMIAIAIQPYKKNMAEKIGEQKWPFEIYFHSNYDLLKDFQEEFEGERGRASFPQAFIFDSQWNFIKSKLGGKVILRDEFKKEGWSDDLLRDQAMENGEYSKLTTDLSSYYEIRNSLNNPDR